MYRLGGSWPGAVSVRSAWRRSQRAVASAGCLARGLATTTNAEEAGGSKPDSPGKASEGPSTVAAEETTARQIRAEQIRKQEQRLRWLRAMVIPAFTLYGLFILRPTNGHFLRYLAERRHLEPSFNALFPPLRKLEEDGDGGGNATSPRRTEPAIDRTTSARETAWLRRRFRTESKEDEERVARRKLLFAREHNYSAVADEDGHVPVVVKSAEQRQRELDEQREHPPMHMLGEQLDAIAALSHAYHEQQQQRQQSPDAGRPPPTPPPIEIAFTDHTFFANASVTLRGPGGETVKTMRFLGVCGMMWKQIA